MRDTFDSLGHLLSKYRYIKLSLENMKTLLPTKEGTFKDKFDPFATQSQKEEAFCFVGDVESFVKEYCKKQGGTFQIPLDCLNPIFILRFCPIVSKFTYGELAIHFNNRIKRGENLPKRLKHKPNLHDIAKDMSKKIEQYFLDKGYISPVIVDTDEP